MDGSSGELSQLPPCSSPTPVNCKCILPGQVGYLTALYELLLDFQVGQTILQTTLNSCSVDCDCYPFLPSLPLCPLLP